jgi:predicted dehydrogenase
MPRIAVLSTAHIHSKGFCKHLVEHTSGKAPYVIWDDHAERGKAYAAEFASRYEPDLGRLLRDPQVQGFIITAENTRHLALLEQVLPLGKPVMCEKPLTTSVSEARQVADLVTRHRTPLISGYFMPFDRKLQAARAAIAGGRLGKVTHVAHRNAHHAAYGRWFDKPELAWFADPKLAGGGALLDLGTHSVHLLRTLFGPVTQVSAVVSNLSGTYATVDDYGLILLRFASGVIGRVEAGWIQQAGPRGLEVFGTQAALWQQDGYRVGSSSSKETEVLGETDAEPKQIDRLIALIQGTLPEASWRADLACCLDAVAIMEATYRSARSAKWEDVASFATVPA